MSMTQTPYGSITIMSPHKLRKTRKRRGTRTVGWGQIGQHRKHGEKGGRKVGRHKHLWSYVLKYEPEYFGKRGFKPPSSRTTINTINISQLDQLIDKLTHEKQITKKQGKPYIDLTTHGYQKLLATGKLTKPILVKVDSYSENAAKKIQEAGGQILSNQTKQETKETEPEKTEKTPEETPKS